MFIDTHVHLNYPPLKDKLELVLQTARKNGVIKIIIPLLKLSDLGWLERNIHRDNLYFSLGIHPSELRESLDFAKVRMIFKQYKSRFPQKIVAIGEIGLDNKVEVDYSLQEKWLLFQIKIAKELSLPLIIHNRGFAKKFQRLIEKGQLQPAAVFHAFIGKPTWAEFLLQHGFYLGLGGLVTYSNFNPRNWLIFKNHLDQLLLETDSPYLIPHGKKSEDNYNQPANVKIIARTIANQLSIGQTEIAKITTKNAFRLFQLQ